LVTVGLEQLRRRLSEYYQSNAVGTVVGPRPGDYCCCQYDVDALYYRAKIVRKYAANKYIVSVVVLVIVVVIIVTAAAADDDLYCDCTTTQRLV